MKYRFGGLAAGLAAGAVGGIVTGGLLASTALFSPSRLTSAGDASSASARVTKEITLGDLYGIEKADGVLTPADSRTVAAEATGTITRLPAAGAVVNRGQALYHTRGGPVILMIGELPAYRTLQLGMTPGPDVRQLEENLRALGHAAGVTVDTQFTEATRQAVLRWQQASGAAATGSVTRREIAVLPGAARVTKALVKTGAPVTPRRPVLAVTGAERTVNVTLRPGGIRKPAVGDSATVRLSSGKLMAGKVGEVTKDTAEIRVTDAAPADETPVTVDFTRRLAQNVLTAPVEGLIALPQGGHVVEVVDAGETRRVPVKPGAYGNGRVEVTGTGLQPGTKIAIPSS